MKKVHNTRQKGEGMPIVLQATMPEGTNAQVDAFQANSDTNTTDSTSQDWLEIMEREAAAENQQVPPEDNNFRKENSTATDIEGSGNLCDDRAEFKEHKNKQSGRDVEPEPVRETVEEKTGNPYINRSQNSELREATEIEQDTYMAMVDAPLETAPTQLNMHNEEIVLPNNLELTSATPIDANKENIAPAGPIRNEEEKDKINNNTLHEQSLLLNNGTTNIIQPEVDDEISLQEITETIDKLPKHKTPGPDGLTHEFYKTFRDKISPLLQMVFNKALNSGVIPDSWQKSVITLLPKKSEELDNINNWRPISLVNADTKIFTKIMADRLNIICKDIIGEYQAGFIKDRSIVDAALDIISTMRSQKNLTDMNWLLFLDQKKAFDRVDHNYLILVLEKMGFSPTFTNLIKSLFGNLWAHITDAGLLSTPFKISRGVRQGDPLSPLLYVIAFEPLLRQLKSKIKGAATGITKFKLTAYADDLTVGLGSIKDWNTLMNLLTKYEAAANAAVNKEKSKLLPLTEKAAQTALPGEGSFDKLDENGSIRILGFEVNKEGQPSKTLWDRITIKLKKLTESMKQRGLSFKGKILIAKSLLLSRVWFASYILPPNRKQLNKINEIMISWIKNKSKLLPRYGIYQQTLENNGLNAPVLPDMLDARLIIIWVKLWSSRNFWAINERAKIEAALLERRKKKVQEALSIRPIRLKGWPCEWKPYLTAWKRLKGEIPDSSKNWPWNLEDLKIMETTATNLTTAKATEYLKKSSIACALTQTNFFSEPNKKDSWAWSQLKWVPNNKKDIFWRLLHNALPLGTRLAYIDPTVSRDCPWCPEVLQTPEHFAMECRVSHKLWELAYNMFSLSQDITLPTTIEEIFTAANAKSTQSHTTFIWLHITVIYEIWVWFTNKRWGKGTMPEPALQFIWKSRIAKEIKLALNSCLLKGKEKDFLKAVYRTCSLENNRT
ncbi:1372_t:CDS:2 [Ambispora leptoticha]|uniref:1372_t:CDS:1 n=1 Tax=Ambispora leptoticha TaxID=144679 RepID=A0A9N9FKB2_9GLOM|nr:1372_t:CDS:2 [Ambispora leptoticha]